MTHSEENNVDYFAVLIQLTLQSRGLDLIRISERVSELTECFFNRKQDIKECCGGLRTKYMTHRSKKRKEKEEKDPTTYPPIKMHPNHSTPTKLNLPSYTGDQSFPRSNLDGCPPTDNTCNRLPRHVVCNIEPDRLIQSSEDRETWPSR